jgi:hypothetical protein
MHTGRVAHRLGRIDIDIDVGLERDSRWALGNLCPPGWSLLDITEDLLKT